MRRVLIVVGLVAVFALAASTQPSPAVAAAPLFEKGQTYDVVVDCVPEWVARAAAPRGIAALLR